MKKTKIFRNASLQSSRENSPHRSNSSLPSPSPIPNRSSANNVNPNDNYLLESIPSISPTHSQMTPLLSPSDHSYNIQMLPRIPRYLPQEPGTSAGSGNFFNFNVQSTKTRGRKYTEEKYQNTVTDSIPSLEYSSTKKYPNGDYQDIEYKICSSTDTESYGSTSKEKLRSNSQTNPVYEQRYGSHRSMSESRCKSRSASRHRKSTSNLTDSTDEAVTTSTLLRKSCSPGRRRSGKKGLAYLASRRGSRDSVVSRDTSNDPNVSEEVIAPLNFHNTNRGRQRRTSNFLELPVPDHERPRVSSLPEKAFNPRDNEDLYKLRTFSITDKGNVVSRGDSIISRRSRSNTSVNSSVSRPSNRGGDSCCGSASHTIDSSSFETPEEVASPNYRVVLLGDVGVGKTSLVTQFMTSEYMNGYDASLDDDFGERSVSILLDGEESEMTFIDHPTTEMSVENCLSTYEPHACIVVYSIVSKLSFDYAEETLDYLWQEDYIQEKSVVIVGNKADLVRSRVITVEDGKILAVTRSCKFIETSSGIQHNVDELLVGVLKQIRLREDRDRKNAIAGGKNKYKLYGSSINMNVARDVLHKLCLKDTKRSKSKSCQNLHVL